MATVITEECINCGACEPECPNTAIYQGGVEWELDGQTHAAISASIFYIVPDKCTECVGFYDHEACAAVCPVDCCVPDPKIPETEAVLLERARKLHPDKEFGADFPSRFKAGGAEAPAAPAGNGAAVAPASSPVPAAAPAPRAVAAPAAGRVEKAKAPPPAKPVEPLKPKIFAGELQDDFEALLQELRGRGSGRWGFAARLVAALLQPLLGALPHGSKQALETLIGDRRFFSNAGATGLNILHNMVLYPAVLVIAAWLLLDAEVFSAQMKWYIFLGTVLASVESIWRLREAFFEARPVDAIRFGPALYGAPLGIVVGPIARRFARDLQVVHHVGYDGFKGGNFDERLERDRRYGDVYRVEDLGRAYLLQLEFPRLLPPTGLKDELGLPDVMPDYDFELALVNGSFVVRGRVIDPRVRKLTAVAAAFPPEFTTQVDLEKGVRGFRHRYRDKVLEVVLPKKD
jgi:ferredoxin